jgi:glutamine synthetase
VVAPELEFYLVARNTDPDMPLKPPIGRSGRAETSRQAYSIDAVNEFDPLFEDVYDYCEKMELNVDTLIHEVGAGQMEINFFHAHPLGLADEVFLFKRTVREAALRHDMFATFMAKPIAGEPGSAMHIHQSVVRLSHRPNIFSNADGTPSQEFFWYIGGLQKLHPGGDGAVRALRQQLPPAGALHGRADQHPVGHRQPHRGHPLALWPAAARRIENRVIGADANPYVALAATLACGYLGIKKRIEPTPECKGDAYLGDFQLPRSLGEALVTAARGSGPGRGAGRGFITVYTEVKEIEYAEFMKVISPWEREHLLLHV